MKYCKHLTMAAAAALMLSTGTAMASGSYVGGYYADFGDVNGLGIEGSFHVVDQVRLFGDLTMLDDDPAELDILRMGGGFVMPLNEQMSVEAGGSFQQWDFTVGDDDAIGLHGIFNFSVTPEFHLKAKGEYLMFDDIDESDIVLGFRGTFFITRAFSVFGGVDIYTHDFIDENHLKLGASFNF